MKKLQSVRGTSDLFPDIKNNHNFVCDTAKEICLVFGFEEIETITVVDILRRSGAQVILGSVQPGPIEGSRGISVLPDQLLEDIDETALDMIILPGGMPGTTNLQNSTRVLEILQTITAKTKKFAPSARPPLFWNPQAS